MMQHTWIITKTDLPQELRFLFNVYCKNCKCENNLYIKVSEIKKYLNYPRASSKVPLQTAMSDLLGKKIGKLLKTCDEYYMCEVME